MEIQYLIFRLQDSVRSVTCISLTCWCRVTHICVSKLTIIASDNNFSPGRRRAIIWTNDGIVLIGPLGTTLNEILIEIHTFSFKKMHSKMSSAKWRPFCLGPNVLTIYVNMCTCKMPHYQKVQSRKSLDFKKTCASRKKLNSIIIISAKIRYFSQQMI